MNVTMDKVKLMEVLEKNKAEHIALYNEAMENYYEVVKKALKTVAKEFEKTKTLNTSPLFLQEPSSYEDQYTEAIEMLRHTTESEISLSQSEFRQYVLDKWSWMNQFSSSNVRYLSPQSSTTLQNKLR